MDAAEMMRMAALALLGASKLRSDTDAPSPKGVEVSFSASVPLEAMQALAAIACSTAMRDDDGYSEEGDDDDDDDDRSPLHGGDDGAQESDDPL